jgi:hypothetical protein
MEKVADFMNRRGYSVTVGNSDDQGFGVNSGPMMLFLGAGNDVIAGLDFPLQHKRQNDHQPLLR